MGLVLSNSNFFINNNSQGRKSVREKSTYSHKFNFTQNCHSVSDLASGSGQIFAKTEIGTLKDFDILIVVYRAKFKNKLCFPKQIMAEGPNFVKFFS